MQFEFDPRKSEINKGKHGIDFVAALALWKSKIIVLGAKDASEKRYMASEQSNVCTGPPLAPIADRRFALLVTIHAIRDGKRMKKSQTEPTTAKNLERKFDRGEEVLDYFDVRKARVIEPQSGASVVKAKSFGAYSVNPNSRPRSVVHEKPTGYRKKNSATGRRSSASLPV